MSESLSPQKPILLVDDEPAFLQSLSMTLKIEAGLNNVQLCSDSREVGRLLQQQEFSLVILDLMMPHMTGLEILEQYAAENVDIPMIILTGMNQIEQAVQCMKVGAFDYFVKTGEIDRLIAGIMRGLKQVQLQDECHRLKSSLFDGRLKHPEVFTEIVTASSKMHDVFRYLEAISNSQEPVLITGDSGVGKELIARAIHALNRPNAPWVAVNVAGLDDAMFSDVLFGHAKGAFTGADRMRAGMIEAAGDGVLFLDEIGDLSQESQVKLLRLLQEREYYPIGSDRLKRCNARIVVASLHDLDQGRVEGRFRTDLYYRLRSHHVIIPALKDRTEDIGLLLNHFLERAADEMSKSKLTYPSELVDWMSQYPFPGNVRELRAMAYDAVSIHQSGKLSMQSFKQSMGMNKSDSTFSSTQTEALRFPERLPTLKAVADQLVEEAMTRTKGNQSIAARLLGISQPSLSVRLKKIRKPE